jgi:hypothetical protein
MPVMFHITCPNCYADLTSTNNRSGLPVTCSQCQHLFTAPTIHPPPYRQPEENQLVKWVVGILAGVGLAIIVLWFLLANRHVVIIGR